MDALEEFFDGLNEEQKKDAVKELISLVVQSHPLDGEITIREP